MLTRQKHSKSRRGCRQCKKGHIKCDETRPACTQCTRRAHDCDYSALRHLRALNPQDIPKRLETKPELRAFLPSYSLVKLESNLYREASLCHGLETIDFRRRDRSVTPTVYHLELRLMHTYLSRMTSIQSIYPNAKHFTTSIQGIMRSATECGYLMDILMGASASWLRSQNPNDHILAEASHNYALRAIRECSKQIREGINETNAEGLFLTSMLVAIHAFVSRQNDIIPDNDNITDGELPLLQWLRSFQGVRAIKEAGLPWLQKSELVGPMLEVLPITVPNGDTNHEPSFSFLLDGLDQEDISMETRAAYGTTVAYLSHLQNDPDRRGLLGFPISVSERFLELLKERDPRALTIFGSYLALMGYSRRSENMLGAADREYHLIMKQLPGEWLPKMGWAENAMLHRETAKRSW